MTLLDIRILYIKLRCIILSFFPRTWKITIYKMYDWLPEFVSRVTWRLLIVEQELHPIRSTWFHPRLSERLSCPTFSCLYSVLQIFVLFFWPLDCLSCIWLPITPLVSTMLSYCMLYNNIILCVFIYSLAL